MPPSSAFASAATIGDKQIELHVRNGLHVFYHSRNIASAMLVVCTLALDWAIPIDHWNDAFYDDH